MLQISPEYTVCHDFGLLNRCLTEGIYYLLDRAYGRNKFTQLFGYLFEEYVNGLIRQFAIESPLLARNFYASPKYESKNDQAGDGILYWDESAVLMEYKSRLLTTRERYAGIPEALIDGVDDILGKEGSKSKKGIVQLASNLKRLLAGENVVAQRSQALDLSGCKTIYPMIVVYEDVVAIEAVRQRAEQKFHEALKKRDVDSAKVGPLLICSLADLELLEVLAKKIETKRLLADYADYLQRNPKARLSTFHSFARKKYKSEIAGLEWWVGQTYLRAWKNVMEEIERRGSSCQTRSPEEGGETAEA